MNINPYLFLEGRCEEAIDFYRQAVGAELLQLLRYSDGPKDAPCPNGTVPPPDKVMHAALQVGSSQLMLSDGMCSGQTAFNGFGVALSLEDDAVARHCFDALAEGGQVVAPLAASFFASSFGMVTDRFGLMWMITVPLQPAG